MCLSVLASLGINETLLLIIDSVHRGCKMNNRILQLNKENTTNHQSDVSEKKALTKNTQSSDAKSGGNVVNSGDHVYTFVGIAG